MKPNVITLIKYTAILLVSFLIVWWIVFSSPINPPEYIPFTPIKLYGFILTGVIITTLILAEKELLKKNPSVSITNLTIAGTMIGFLNEVFFHCFLSFTVESDRLYQFLVGVTSTTLFEAVLSFFVAFQIKTKRTKQLLLFIFAFVVLFKLLTLIFPSLVKP